VVLRVDRYFETFRGLNSAVGITRKLLPSTTEIEAELQMTNDDTFLRLFEAQAILRADWNHRSHLRIAYIYLTRLPFETALNKMRDGVRAYNAANGIEDTPTSGYHETMTCAFMHLVYSTLCQYGASESSGQFLNEHSQLNSKRILLLFYSRNRIMSAEAKDRFIEPDLAPLPKAMPNCLPM